MGRSLQIMVIAMTVMIPTTFANYSATCRPGYESRASQCVLPDTDQDDAAEASGRVVHKVEECTRIERLLANPQTRQLMMQGPEGRQTVWWYAGNCPLRKSKG